VTHREVADGEDSEVADEEVMDREDMISMVVVVDNMVDMTSMEAVATDKDTRVDTEVGVMAAVTISTVLAVMTRVAATVVVMVEDTAVDMIRVLEDTVVMEDRINIR